MSLSQILMREEGMHSNPLKEIRARLVVFLAFYKGLNTQLKKFFTPIYNCWQGPIQASHTLFRSQKVSSKVTPPQPTSVFPFPIRPTQLYAKASWNQHLRKIFQLLIYADDIELLKTSIQLMNKSLKIIHKYLSIKILTLNHDKTKVILFRKKKTSAPPPKYSTIM